MNTWAWLILGLLLGLAGGFLLGRGGGPARQSRKIDRELQDTREELLRYRERVVAHFSSTADLVNAMSANYAALHRQLTQDAQELCNGREPGLKAISLNDGAAGESAPTQGTLPLPVPPLPLPGEKTAASRAESFRHTRGWYRESASEDEASDYVKEDPRY